MGSRAIGGSVHRLISSSFLEHDCAEALHERSPLHAIVGASSTILPSPFLRGLSLSVINEFIQYFTHL